MPTVPVGPVYQHNRERLVEIVEESEADEEGPTQTLSFWSIYLNVDGFRVFETKIDSQVGKRGGWVVVFDENNEKIRISHHIEGKGFLVCYFDWGAKEGYFWFNLFEDVLIERL